MLEAFNPISLLRIHESIYVGISDQNVFNVVEGILSTLLTLQCVSWAPSDDNCLWPAVKSHWGGTFVNTLEVTLVDTRAAWLLLRGRTCNVGQWRHYCSQYNLITHYWWSTVVYSLALRRSTLNNDKLTPRKSKSTLAFFYSLTFKTQGNDYTCV